MARKAKIYTVNGFTGTLKEIAEHFKINYATLQWRMQKGMSVEEAVNCDIKRNKKYTADGFTGTLYEIAEHFGIKYSTLRNRMQKGMTLEEAINYGSRYEKYTINGFKDTLYEIAKRFGINYHTLSSRIRQGMTIEEAINVPLINVHTKNLSWKGKKMGLKDICELEGKDLESVYKLLKSNHTLEWAVEHAKDVER